MRYPLLSVALLCGSLPIFAGCRCTPSASVPENTPRIQATSPNQLPTQIVQMLRGPIPITFHENRLVNIETYFANVVGSDVAFDWDALRRFGVTEDTLVTLDLPQVPSRTAIRLSLYAAIAGQQKHPAPLEDLDINFRYDDEKIVATVAGSDAIHEKTHKTLSPQSRKR